MNLYSSQVIKHYNWYKPIKWCAFLFNMKIVYTTRWRLFATPDTPCPNLCSTKNGLKILLSKLLQSELNI